MKIIIPLNEDKKEVCIVLGRAPFYLMHDTQNNKETILKNPATSAESGAGLKSAQFIVDSDADALITVRCGENASKVLKAADIKIYKSEATLANENIELLKQGKLNELDHFHSGYHGIK